MTTYNRASLKTFFETGDVPNGGDYSNLIDSCLNLVDTSAQTIASPIIPAELISARVSAGNLTSTLGSTLMGSTSCDQVYANTISVSGVVVNSLQAASLTLAGNVSAAGGVYAATGSYTGKVSAASLNVTGDVSAATGTVYASAVRSTNGVIGSSNIVSAAGTTQGTAAVLTNVINRGKGVVDGTTTGFTPLANNAGLVQYLLNEGVSANLWPPTGGFINGLAVNTPFSLAASSAYTIFHITASSYGVK